MRVRACRPVRTVAIAAAFVSAAFGVEVQAQAAEPPHPILPIAGDGSGAAAILAGYSEQQFIEYVPRQSPRNPELSAYGGILVAGDVRWSWSAASPNQLLSLPSGTVFPNQTYPTVTHNVPVLSGKVVQVTNYQNLARTRSAFVNAVIDFHKSNTLRGFLSQLAAAYVRSGTDPHGRDDRYARRIAVALDAWADAVPDYYMTGKNSGSFISAEGFTRMTTDIQRASTHNGLAHEWSEAELRAFDAIYDSRALAQLSLEKGYDVRAHIAADLFGNIGDFIVQRAPVEVAIKSNLSEPFIVLASAARVLNRPDWMPWLGEYLEQTVGSKIMRDGVLGEGISYSYGYVRKNRDTARNIRDYFLTRAADTPELERILGRVGAHVRLLEFGIEQWNAMRLPDSVMVGFGDTQFGGVQPAGAANSHLLPAYGIHSLGAGEGDQAVELHQIFADDANHMRADVTAFTLYAMSAELLGNIRYFNGTPGRQFGEQILAHNAVTIDRSNMSRGGWTVGNRNHRFTSGNLTLYEPGGDGLAVSEIDGQRAYANRASRYQRVMLLNTADPDHPYVLDVFRVAGGRTHDYTLHGAIRFDQTWESSLPLTPDPAPYPMLEGGETWAEPTSSGSSFPYYGFWRDVARGPASGDFQITYRDISALRRDLRLWVTDPGAATVNLGRTPIAERTNDEPPDFYKYWRPSLILRRRAAEGPLDSLFVNVVEPLRGGVSAIASVQRVPLAEAGLDAVAVRITFADGRVDTCLVNLHNPRVAGAAGGSASVRTADGRFALTGRVGVHAAGPLGERAWTVAASDFRFGGAGLSTPRTFYQGTVGDAVRDAAAGTGAFVTDAPLPAGDALKGRQLSLVFDTYRVVPASSGIVQRGISEMFEIDHVEDAGDGRCLVHLVRDHQLVMAGGTATEQMAPERTFEGPFSFEVALAARAAPIPPLADRRLAVDEVATVAFEVADLLSTPADRLTVGASSSDPAVVADSGLVVAGSGAHRTLTITPQPGVSGRTVVTIAAGDGVNATTRSFTVTLGRVDDPPTISPIADQLIGVNEAAGPLAFTIGDEATAPDALVVSASSSDPALVPAEGLVLEGSGAVRSVTVVPAPERSGHALITLRVGDGVHTSAVSFGVDVDDRPRISAIPDRAIPGGGSTGPIPFRVSDRETAAEQLAVAVASSDRALVPLAAVRLAGSGAERTVTATPAGESGTAVITLTVGDGLRTASTSFTLTVDAPPLLSAIGDRTIPEDGTTGALAFSVADREGAASSLTVSAASSNPELVPEGAIVIRPEVNPWSGADVGAVAAAGSSVAGDVFTIRASGADIWGTADEGHFLSQPASGDAELVARITSVQETHVWAKAGVMFRATGHAASPHVFLLVSAASGVSFQRRLTHGASVTSNVVAGVRPPAWVRLVKAGTTFTGFYAVDQGGMPGPWIQVGAPITAELGASFLQGLAATSHQDGAVTTATFDNVSGPASVGGSHSVTVTPAPERSGTAVITLRASDGVGTTSRAFTLTVTPVNDVPELSALDDRAIAEDASTGAIAFQVGDVETPAAALAVEASSSDPELVPPAGLVLAGEGAARRLTVTPAPDRHGTAVITVRVSDGAAAATAAFQLTVAAVPDAPTISRLADRRIGENRSSGPIAFDVGDVDSPVEGLALAASSSNPALIDPTGIVFGGSGARRTVTITPRPNRRGSALVTITVGDGTAVSAAAFVVAVEAAPTISRIARRVIAEDGSTGAIGFLVTDADTPAAALAVTAHSSDPALLSASGIVLGGRGSNRFVTLTPAPDAHGEATVTLTVDDGVSTAASTLLLVVTPVNDAPTVSALADQSVAAGGSTGPLAFTIGDVETDPALLTLTASSSSPALVPEGAVVLAGEGAARTVTVAAAPNRRGRAVITLIVSDGRRTARTSFAVTVR